MHKADVVAIGLTAWMLTLSGLMSILRVTDLRLFIATALVGFFIIVYIIQPAFSKPGYIRRIYRMAIAFTALFGLVILARILELTQYWG